MRMELIPDINTKKFWDKEFFRDRIIDPMTNDRINTICKIIINNAKKDTKNKLFDLGIGDGWVEQKLKDNKYFEFNGIDISEVAIDKLNKKLKGNFNVNNVYSFESNNLYDTVLALEILEHIPQDKIYNVLLKIKEF